MTATDHARVLTTLSENLRQINSLHDFVAAAKSARRSPVKC
jgi:hypothetical protein